MNLLTSILILSMVVASDMAVKMGNVVSLIMNMKAIYKTQQILIEMTTKQKIGYKKET